MTDIAGVGLLIVIIGWAVFQHRQLVKAHTDPTTGLSTDRARLYRRIARSPGQCVALMDVNGLKKINDRLGHDAGDDYLGVVGERLRQATIRGDRLVRLHGDEFALVSRRSIDAVALAVRDAFEAPTEVAVENLGVSVSAGYAISRGDASVAMKLADEEMYRSKRSVSVFER